VGNIFDLMFEISNEDRFGILLRLEEGAMNVTGLARELGLTTQETSRHLSRLVDVSLTSKDAEGMFTITSFGGLTLRLLHGLKFISKHEDYFTTHNLGNLPNEYVCRMGELMDSTYLDDVMVMVHNTENILKEAEEYVLNINMPFIASVFPFIKEAYERGVKGRFIHTDDLRRLGISLEEQVVVHHGWRPLGLVGVEPPALPLVLDDDLPYPVMVTHLHARPFLQTALTSL